MSGGTAMETNTTTSSSTSSSGRLQRRKSNNRIRAFLMAGRRREPTSSSSSSFFRASLTEKSVAGESTTSASTASTSLHSLVVQQQQQQLQQQHYAHNKNNNNNNNNTGYSPQQRQQPPDRSGLRSSWSAASSHSDYYCEDDHPNNDHDLDSDAGVDEDDDDESLSSFPSSAIPLSTRSDASYYAEECSMDGSSHASSSRISTYSVLRQPPTYAPPPHNILARRHQRRQELVHTRVEFDFADVAFYPSQRDLDSPDEWKRCWYSQSDLDQFKKDQAEAVKKLFSKASSSASKHKQHHQRVVARTPSFTERLRNRPRGSVSSSSRNSQYSNTSNHTTSSTTTSYHDWRQILLQAYQECRKVKRGDMNILTGKVDRGSLKRVYDTHTDLVGLEVYVLFALRGSVSHQVHRILEYWVESHRRCTTLEEAEGVFLKTCRSLTQPASVLCHEIAMAQAAALYFGR